MLHENFWSGLCTEATASKLERQQDMLAAQQVKLIRQLELLERCQERLNKQLGGVAQYIQDRPPSNAFAARILTGRD
jgi:hypothetical protein